MSEVTPPPTTIPLGAAPSVPAAPAAAAPSAAPPAAPPTDPGVVSMSSEALKKRLDEERAKERKTFLKANGFDSEEAFTAAMKAAKDAADAKLTADEKTAARLKELEPKAERATKLEARFEADVKRRLGRLDEATQAKIAKAAGDNPSADDLDKYVSLFEGEDGAPPPPPPVPQGKKPAAAPAATTTAPPAPPPGGGPLTAYETYVAKQATDPAAAAIYLSCNGAAINASRPAPQAPR
jgi:hypothetical protein